jgi:NAD(P)-dependent dehydrogenase (short-subunit alcohol dehydrogenase family)
MNPKLTHADHTTSCALVTGAGGAVGRSVTLGLARHGVRKIAGLDLNAEALEGTAGALFKASPEVEFIPLKVDLTSEEAVSASIATAANRFGRIDFAINVAGIGQPLAATGETASSDFDKVMNVNFRAAWLCEKYELQQMNQQEPRKPSSTCSSIVERGAIVNVSSVLGYMAMPHLGIYNSSKHALLGLTRTDAIDYAKRGIRVNAVAPGFIDTPLLLDATRRALKSTIDRIPQGRLAAPEEVADVIVFLCSGFATHITGVTLPVDGGLSIT